jgi:hypothetical protein
VLAENLLKSPYKHGKRNSMYLMETRVSLFSGDDAMLICNLSPTFRSKLLPPSSKEAKNINLLRKFVALYREVPACISLASLATEEARSAETLIRNYESK